MLPGTSLRPSAPPRQIADVAAVAPVRSLEPPPPPFWIRSRTTDVKGTMPQRCEASCANRRPTPPPRALPPPRHPPYPSCATRDARCPAAPRQRYPSPLVILPSLGTLPVERAFCACPASAPPKENLVHPLPAFFGLRRTCSQVLSPTPRHPPTTHQFTTALQLKFTYPTGSCAATTLRVFPPIGP